MKDPRFVLIQHAHGAAGKFVTILLMCSPEVAHFDPWVNANRSADALLNYAKQCFTTNIGQWLKNEPKPQQCWNLHFVSPSYPRGEELDQQQFTALARQHGTAHFHTAVEQQQMICMSWHKQRIPEYFQSSPRISVIIDPLSEKWFHRALWYKHFGLDQGRVHQKSHDPTYNAGSVTQYYQQFNNAVFVDTPPRKFIRDHIINGTQKQLFSQASNFTGLQQLSINLSDVISVDGVQDVTAQMYRHLDLGMPDADLVHALHQHWRSCHGFKYS